MGDGPRWLPDNSGLLMLSDAEGWFQVVRISMTAGDRVAITTGRQEHGEPGGGWGYVPCPRRMAGTLPTSRSTMVSRI